ncbi:MAG TPA: ATP12 family protein [Novosphingobium sp.]|nr:ATP12 family protein [Novosphingobium sp.]HQA18572.1 ATP12 family protein [Novosphingobium sp.]
MKRFYKDAAFSAEGSGWRVTLDGRGVKSPGGRPQVVPSPALAEALAAEWAAQGEEIDPAAFVLRDLADYAIDVVATGRDSLIATLLGYAETDTLCYRADPEEPLHARQLAVWEPLLLAAESRWDVRFQRVCGIVHRPQPGETLGRLKAALTAYDDFSLAALNTLTSLAASLVIGLAALEPDADIAALWQAAELEENWQAEQWGLDAEAEARQARRFAGFAAAARFAELVRG